MNEEIQAAEMAGWLGVGVMSWTSEIEKGAVEFEIARDREWK